MSESIASFPYEMRPRVPHGSRQVAGARTQFRGDVAPRTLRHRTRVPQCAVILMRENILPTGH